jgi:hypothetical protein
LMPKGGVLTIYPCGGGVVVCISMFIYLSILGLWTCMNLIVWCDGWWWT